MTVMVALSRTRQFSASPPQSLLGVRIALPKREDIVLLASSCRTAAGTSSVAYGELLNCFLSRPHVTSDDP